MRVLYVEDDSNDADLAQRALARYTPPIDLEIAPTLSEARRRLAEKVYDVALVDLHLPDGRGMDLLFEIREKGLPLAVVVLTGMGDEEIAVAALKAGADDYLAKHSGYWARLPLTLEMALQRYRAEAARHARPLRVLYVEHNALDSDLTLRHFARHAPYIRCDAVYTAAAAFERLPLTNHEPCAYDVLLLDYRMPGLNALEMLKTLRRERGLDLPIVLVTGQGDEEVAAYALRLGATDYLSKHPNYLFQLPIVLENAFHRVQLAREQVTLRRHEENFRLLFQSNPYPIWVYDLETLAILEVNDAAIRHYGYSRDEFLTLRITDICPPEDVPLLLDYLRTRASVPLRSSGEWRHRLKSGAIIDVEVTSRSLDYAGRKAALVVALDITERKRVQAAEAEQRTLAEALRDTASALISAIDIDQVMYTILGNVARVVPHDAANIMLIEGDHARPVYWRGYPDELGPLLRDFRISIPDTPNLAEMTVTGQSFLISYTDQYAGWIRQPVVEWVQSYLGIPICSHKQVIGFINLDSATPGFFNEAHVQRLQAFADQASIALEHAQLYDEIRRYATTLEQRVAERTAELQRSEERYRAIVEDQTELVCRFLPGGILTFVNRTYCEHMNQPPEALLGKSFYTFLPDEERAKVESLIASLDREHPVGISETHELSSTGQDRWVQWVNRMLFDPEGHFIEYQSVGRDITERKLAEEQLRQTLEREMELSEMKSRFVSIASHELRTPLAVIQTSADLLRRYSDRLSPEDREKKFRRIQDSIADMVEILEDVLTISKGEAGRLEFHPAMLDVVTFCQTIVEDFQRTVGEHHELVFSHDGGYGEAYVDESLLRHVLENLLSNAIKYSPAGSTVRLDVICEDESIRFQVQDQGIGVPLSDQARLFEAFHRAANVGAVPGSGLGLTIVKQLVDLHGGTITFESEEGKGSTFFVTLPRLTKPPAPSPE